MSASYDKIETFITNIHNWGLSWSKVHQDQMEFDDMYVVALRKHPIRMFDFEKGVASLRARICESILVDVLKDRVLNNPIW